MLLKPKWFWFYLVRDYSILAMLMGEYNHTIDVKGRITIPVRFRGELKDHFVVTRGLDRDCLQAYPYERWQKIADNLAKISLTSEVGRKLTRILLGNAVECEVDKMGRILLPQNLRMRVGLDKNVVLVGLGDRIEIWDESNWNRINAPDVFETLTDEELKNLEGLEL